MPANACHIVTYFEVTGGAEQQAANLIEQLADAGRKDAGNLRFEILNQIGRPRHFAILEAWSDQAAADAHAAAAQTVRFRDSLKALQSAPYDARPHDPLAVADLTFAGGSDIVHVVTHVDLIPPKKDEGIAATVALAEPSRKEPGNLRFEVLQQVSRPNHLTVVEAWESRQAQRAHAAAAHVKRYRETVFPMSGGLYDERLYLAVGGPRRP